MAARILVVDDDPGIVKILSDRLRHQGFEVVTASDGVQGLEAIATLRPDIVLLDLEMPVMDGMQTLQRLQDEKTDVTVIVITAFGSIRRAVEAMKAGAYDFLTKPLEFDLVQRTISRAVEREKLKAQIDYFREESSSRFPGIVGASPEMGKSLETARRAAFSDTTVLLLGETGTGKEVLARAIHNWSPRGDKPFIAINCAALPDQLLESELFGHEKGAFTGAHKLRRGRFELAADGTLFLDEIAEMQLATQAKLLRVLEGHGFERLGGSTTINSLPRIVAATNRDLKISIGKRKFREDLYHRLNVISIEVPALRKRKEDIGELAASFIDEYCRATTQPTKNLSARAVKALHEYDWPGNVRELKNVIERAVVLTAEEKIELEDLPDQIVESAFSSSGKSAQPGAGYHEAVAEYKRKLIKETLRSTDGNQTKAAELLDLQRTYLARLIKQLHVQ